eukprot:359337-Chlamydomonas_euryale.AAC.2
MAQADFTPDTLGLSNRVAFPCGTCLSNRSLFLTGPCQAPVFSLPTMRPPGPAYTPNPSIIHPVLQERLMDLHMMKERSAPKA